MSAIFCDFSTPFLDSPTTFANTVGRRTFARLPPIWLPSVIHLNHLQVALPLAPNWIRRLEQREGGPGLIWGLSLRSR